MVIICNIGFVWHWRGFGLFIGFGGGVGVALDGGGDLVASFEEDFFGLLDDLLVFQVGGRAIGEAIFEGVGNGDELLDELGGGAAGGDVVVGAGLDDEALEGLVAGAGGAEFVVAAVVCDEAGQFAVVGVGVDDILMLAAGGVDGGEENVIDFGGGGSIGHGREFAWNDSWEPPFNLSNVLSLTVGGRLLGL